MRIQNGMDAVLLEYLFPEFVIFLKRNIYVFEKIGRVCLGAVINKYLVPGVQAIDGITADIKVIEDAAGQLMLQYIIGRLLLFFVKSITENPRIVIGTVDCAGADEYS